MYTKKKFHGSNGKISTWRVEIKITFFCGQTQKRKCHHIHLFTFWSTAHENDNNKFYAGFVSTTKKSSPAKIPNDDDEEKD